MYQGVLHTKMCVLINSYQATSCQVAMDWLLMKERE